MAYSGDPASMSSVALPIASLMASEVWLALARLLSISAFATLLYDLVVQRLRAVHDRLSATSVR